MDTLTLFWIVAAVCFGIAEAATVQLISIWFCIAAVLASVTAAVSGSLWVSVIVFVLASAVIVALVRPIVKSKVMVKPQPTNADRIIGREALVTTPIDSSKNEGQIKIDGQVWSAKCDEIIPEGETVRVEKIEGVKVVVKK